MSALDALLRDCEFTIVARPRRGPVRWRSPRGRIITQDEALTEALHLHGWEPRVGQLGEKLWRETRTQEVLSRAEALARLMGKFR